MEGGRLDFGFSASACKFPGCGFQEMGVRVYRVLGFRVRRSRGFRIVGFLRFKVQGF